MSADSSRIDLVLQYALLIAGEQDEYNARQLGPIHLLKYVYLADLFYAKKHEGTTYTGIRWRFYKFGPWSQAVNERIEPALGAIGAERSSFASQYTEKQDWERWNLRNKQLLQQKKQHLPTDIKLPLKRDILEFGKDTQGLLHYVYRTKPMLHAAPGEYLDFKVDRDSSVEEISTGPLRAETLSNRKKKQFKERMASLQEKHKNRQRPDSKLINPVKNPRYDDIYNEGVAWLDSLAGQSFSEMEYVAEFSDEVWKSTARKGTDVP